MVLPVRKVQGLHLADVRNVAVDPRTVQTDEDPQGAGAPPGVFREEGEKGEQTRDAQLDERGQTGGLREAALPLNEEVPEIRDLR